MKDEKHRTRGQLGIGIFLLIAGLVMLLNNFNIMDHMSAWKFWPVILIAIGFGKFLDARFASEYQKAVWWLFLGAWFLVSELNLFGMNYHNSWPILLIGIGLGMLWKSFYTSNEIAKDQCNGHST